MIELRDYQKAPVKLAIKYFRSNSQTPSLIVLPTGWGKSILTAYVAKYINPEDRLLVVQPTKELLEQNYGKYVALCGEMEPAGIYSASFGKKDVQRITYATIGSIKSLGGLFKSLGFTKMLIDEAHLYPRKEQSMLGQFLSDSGILQVLGITATPLKLEQFGEKQQERFDKWSELIMLTNPSPEGTFFKQILHVGQIQEMISLHYWSPLIYEILPFDPAMLRYNSTGSEFSEDSEAQAYAFNNVRANIFGALNYHAERRHCIVFVPSVEEARILSQEYPGSACLSGDTPKKERDRIVNEFREGKIRVLFNVSVLSCGFDYPKIDMIILGFSTASVAKFYQIAGRGVRIHPDKKDCLIVDMGGNIDRFGRPEDIYFEYAGKWRMYGTGGKLLTGLPIDCIGSVSHEDVANACTYGNPSLVVEFGKHKGMKVSEMPMSYRKWLLKNRQQNEWSELKDALIRSIEEHVRDTRNEPMMKNMPDGKHAGEPIEKVPKGYLGWYYRSKTWNECNDSLRRALEFHLGIKVPMGNHS